MAQMLLRGLQSAFWHQGGRFAAPASSKPLRAFSSSAYTPSSTPRLIEVREYTIKPSGYGRMLEILHEYGSVRKELLPGFMGMFTCDVGGCLHKVTHFYHYQDYDERDRIRAKAARDPRWSAFLTEARPHVQHQVSRIMLEAGPIYKALGIPHTHEYTSPARPKDKKIVYEMRNYQLHAGYGSVPKLVEAFKEGLPAKVAADPEKGELVFFGYTDVGTLNKVTELWRYPSAQSCIRARQAARAVPQWKEAVGKITPGVQQFTSEFLHPAPFSLWQ